MPDIYINIHIPKNAGQTFDGILRRRFGPALAHAPSAFHGQILSGPEKQAFLEQNLMARCITGHTFRYPAPPVPGRRFRYLTFLREPVERLVSLYAYERKLEAGRPHPSQRPIEEWLDIRLTEDNALTDYQAFHLLGATDPAQVSLEAALRRLDDYFLAGITERFDDSLLLLSSQADFSLYDLRYLSQNVTGSKAAYPIRPAVRQRLLDLNPVDVELYRLALERFEARLRDSLGRRLDAQREALRKINQSAAAQYPFAHRSRHRAVQWLRALGRTARAAPGLKDLADH